LCKKLFYPSPPASRTIFSEKGTRNLFLFLILNLSFAFVELLWGMWTNSLGLISDSFHMFFDCTALLAGLVATVVARWAANEKFSYGYVRAEVVAGFVNTLFLLFVAFFIFAEAIEARGHTYTYTQHTFL
jgi:zinc transporter 5/7